MRITRDSDPRLRQLVAAQRPDLAAELGIGKGPAKAAPTQRNARYAALLEHARARIGELPVGDAPLQLWLPEFVLPSLNAIIHGAMRKENQAASKRAAQQAVWSYEGDLWRFERRVDVYFVQYLASAHQAADPDNLYTKYLLDALRDLGVIADDRLKFVRRVSRETEIRPGLPVGVLILLVPVDAEVLPLPLAQGPGGPEAA